MVSEQKESTQMPSEKIRQIWLESMLPEVAFCGWIDSVATKAAEEAGLDAGQQALGAPSGVIDLIEQFFKNAETEAKLRIEEIDFTGFSVRDRVATGTMEWLRALENDKEAVRRAISWGMLPWRLEQPLQRLWRVSDMIWTAAGDTSTDYNQYSKRGLLAMALPSIILHWIEYDDPVELREFVDRQINRASTFGRKSSAFPRQIWECISAFGGKKES